VYALQPGTVNEDGTFTLNGFGSGFAGPVRVRDGSGREGLTSDGNQCQPSSSSYPTTEVSTGTITPEEAFASIKDCLIIVLVK
jgi:hypothetical protein